MDPESLGAAYGLTDADPVVEVGLTAGDPGPIPSGPPIWDAATGPDGVRQTAWRDGEAVVIAIAADPVIRVAPGEIVVTDRDAGLVMQLVTTFGLPLLAHRAGMFVLHGCAAVRDEAALVVCGVSGAGKSSLLVALTDAGWEPLTEDVCAIALGPLAPTAFPGPPWVRVRAGSAGPAGVTERFRSADKVAWDLGPGRRTRPAPLARIVLLDPPDEEGTDVRPVPPHEVMAALAAHAPWLEEPHRRAEELWGRAVTLARAVPTTRLRVRRRPDWTAEAVAAIGALRPL